MQDFVPIFLLTATARFFRPVRSLDLLFHEQLLRRAICRPLSLYRSDISYVNLNIYYYCSVSRTSLPILTAIIIGPGQGLRAKRLFLILRMHYLFESKRFYTSILYSKRLYTFFRCSLLAAIWYICIIIIIECIRVIFKFIKIDRV